MLSLVCLRDCVMHISQCILHFANSESRKNANREQRIAKELRRACEFAKWCESSGLALVQFGPDRGVDLFLGKL